jgi:hypothetical protein
MLSLASMVWAAFMFVKTEMHQNNTPLPVVIETGETYAYDTISSSITVSHPWNDSCYNQGQVVYEMAIHFNAFRNGNHKLSNDKLIDIKNKWKCVQ